MHLAAPLVIHVECIFYSVCLYTLQIIHITSYTLLCINETSMYAPIQFLKTESTVVLLLYLTYGIP